MTTTRTTSKNHALHAESEGFCTPAAHCITLETEVTSHYYHASARNRRLNDPEFDAVHLGFLEAAFNGQDAPMLSAVQARMGSTGDLFSFQPVLLPVDGPAQVHALAYRARGRGRLLVAVGVFVLCQMTIVIQIAF
jgi:hypothetical protein